MCKFKNFIKFILSFYNGLLSVVHLLSVCVVVHTSEVLYLECTDCVSLQFSLPIQLKLIGTNECRVGKLCQIVFCICWKKSDDKLDLDEQC